MPAAKKKPAAKAATKPAAKATKPNAKDVSANVKQVTQAVQAAATTTAEICRDKNTGEWQMWFRGRLIGTTMKEDGHKYLIGKITKGYSAEVKQLGITDYVIVEEPSKDGALPAAVQQAIANRPQFEITERFDFLSMMTDMVITGKQPSLVVTGEGGLGKTHEVMDRIRTAGMVNIDKFMEEAGLKEGDEGLVLPQDGYVVRKGYSTARGLYIMLYNYRNHLIVLDDCDDPLRDPTAVNLLKAALDSYDERRVTWMSDRSMGGMPEDIPTTFLFTGRIICISNRRQEQIDQAIRSRALSVDLSMTTEEKITWMKAKLQHVCPEVAMQYRRLAMGIIEKHAASATDLNFRTLIKVSKMIEAHRSKAPEVLERFALYAMTSNSEGRG